MLAVPHQLPLDLPHRASLARDDLIVTDANRLAVAAVDSFPDWPHPVLLIVGPPGSGKSHLAAAWQEMTGAVRFSGGEASNAVRSGRPFAVVIDDIDRGGASEAGRFGIVNAARLGGGFVLATARVKPAAMTLALPDLRSRLQAATLSQIGRPDDALLTGVLAKLFADRQIAIDPKLMLFIARRMERSLDAASRLVAAIDREALASKDRVSRHLVQRVLARPELGDGVDRPAGTGEEDERSVDDDRPAAAAGPEGKD